MAGFLPESGTQDKGAKKGQAKDQMTDDHLSVSPVHMGRNSILLLVFGYNLSSGSLPANVYFLQNMECVLYKCAACIVKGVKIVLYKAYGMYYKCCL